MTPALPPAARALAGALLSRCRFPPAPGPATAAVSGGADSLALLILAVTARLEVTAVHVDHGLRAGSAGEGAAVAAVATRLGAAYRQARVTVPPGPDLEARARAARYGVLPAGVLTGHTADDQAETMLVNLLRGAGVRGLAAMTMSSPGRPRSPGLLPEAGAPAPPGPYTAEAAGVAQPSRVVRPLLALRRSETAELCRLAGIDPVADPSNDDPRFVRNRIRHELLPLLADIAGRDPVPVLVRQAGLLGADADLLDGLAATLDPTDAKALAAAPPPLAHRAVREWLRAGPERHPPSAAEVARVMAVARGEAVACEVHGGRRVARRAGRLRVAEPPPPCPPEPPPPLPD